MIAVLWRWQDQSRVKFSQSGVANERLAVGNEGKSGVLRLNGRKVKGRIGLNGNSNSMRVVDDSVKISE
jgi:hypothetical protein